MTVLFQSGFERGDPDLDNIAISGNGYYALQGEIVHTGSHAAKLTVKPSFWTAQPGVRLVYYGANRVLADNPRNLPDEAYYSAYFYLPYVKTPWINLMQWKQARSRNAKSQARDPVAFIKIEGKNDRFYISLQTRVSASGFYVAGSNQLAAFPEFEVPIGQWFELLCYYKWDRGHQGRICTWVNGVELWDIRNIQTEYDAPFNSYPREATWNNYAASVSPNPYSLYVDDIKVWAV